jgi:uncharacterized damage-inducible protein DinB
MSAQDERKPESYQNRERLVKRFPSARRAKSRSIVVTPEVRAYIRKTDKFRAGRDPIALMKIAPGKFARAVAGLTANQMRRRPARGKWSIIEILGHLYDTEVVYGWRYRLTLSEPKSAIQGYDQVRWVEELRHRSRGNAKRLLDQIRVAREANLEVLLHVPRRQWNRFGIHSERGRQTVRRTVEMIAGHDLNHIDQIKAIRRKYAW